MIGSTDFPKVSHLKKRAFLAAFSGCGSLSKAAKRAKVDRRTHYNWLKDDSWYVYAFRQAVIEAGDSLQDKLTEIEQVNIQDMDIDRLSPEMLDKIAEHLLKKALGENAPIAEIDRRRRRSKHPRSRGNEPAGGSREGQLGSQALLERVHSLSQSDG